MFTSTLLALLSLGPLALVSAQMDGKSYCKLGDEVPDREACMVIAKQGPKASEFYGRATWRNGNCEIQAQKANLGSHVGGDDLKNSIIDILNQCDVGFQYRKNVRVEVRLCKLGLGGVETVCSGPLHRADGGIFNRGIQSSTLPRRHLTDIPTTQPDAHIISRDDSDDADRNIINTLFNSDEFVKCGGGPAAATIEKCIEIADKLVEDGPTVSLPVEEGDGDCQLHIWPTSKDRKQVNTGLILERVKATTAKCGDPTNTLIGFIDDFSPDANDYHIFLGQFCGRLGAGISGACFPGGK